MTAMALQDAAGRRRSPPTLPGYHAGRPPRNKGLRYSADPPSVEEIIAVMRQAGTTTQGLRARALIVVLWRAGLRIGEALALGERDLDERRGSVLHLDELRLRSNELGTVASDEALRVNNQTLSRVPGDPVASNRLGIALLALGRHAEAEEVLVSAVKAHPDNRIAARRLEEARAKLSRTQAPPRSVRRASARHVAQQVHVCDLVQAGLISADEPFFGHWNGVVYEARFAGENNLRLTGSPQVTGTPSGLAERIRGSKFNGWRFWRVLRGDRGVPLGDLRATLFKGRDKPKPPID